MKFFRVSAWRLFCVPVKLVSALENKEQLIRLRYMEKVQQVHKQAETDNDRRAVIHWSFV